MAAIHMSWSNDGRETRCGKRDVVNTLDRGGLPYVPSIPKTDDWAQVTCKACLKAYVWPTSAMRANGTWGRNGFTARVVMPEAAPRPVWDTAAFWEEIFTQSPDGRQGRILRIGPYRITDVNGGWAALEDGADPQLEHLQYPTLQAAVNYCIARSVHHRGRDNYAVARWSVDDVHSYREETELPEWTDDQASDFLAGAEGNIQDRMIEAGWEALETLIRMDEEDEDIHPET